MLVNRFKKYFISTENPQIEKSPHFHLKITAFHLNLKAADRK